jgi:hypothetical protein
MTAAVSAARPRAGRLRPGSLAGLALAEVIVYVAIDVLLRFLQPGYSLLYNAESDYGRGAWYWVMDLNFLLRCALSLGIAAALRRAVSADDRLRGGPGSAGCLGGRGGSAAAPGLGVRAPARARRPFTAARRKGNCQPATARRPKPSALTGPQHW